MKMRKLFAGLAAAATLFGGLAFGATTANAAEGDAAASNAAGCLVTAAPTDKTVTINSTAYENLIKNATPNAGDTYQGRDFTAVKLADYTTEELGTSGKYTLKVSTVSGVANTLKDVLNGLNIGYSNADDPVQFISGLTPDDGTTAEGDKTVRKVAEKLKDTDFGNATVTLNQNTVTKTGATGGAMTLTLGGPGVYLLRDQTGTVQIGSTNYLGSNPIIIGTKIDGIDGQCTIANNGGTVNIKNSSETLGGFQFKKTDADGNDLAGAKFVISKQDGATIKYGTYDEGAAQNQWDWKTDKPADGEGAGPKTGVFTSGANGVVKFENLENGTYTVEEIKAPNGFIQSVLPKFTVKVKDGKLADDFTGDQFGLAIKTVSNGTVSVTVKNVKSITQLPLTGAAGTILFTIVGLLLAAAAGTVFVKSRSTKRALRA